LRSPAPRAKASALVLTQKRQGQSRIYELPNQVLGIECIADEDVSFAERIIVANETLIDLDPDRPLHLFEAPIAKARNRGVDRSTKFNPPAYGPHDQPYCSRGRESIPAERGQVDGSVKFEFAPGTEHTRNVDLLKNTHNETRSTYRMPQKSLVIIKGHASSVNATAPPLPFVSICVIFR
jgi:hypothetical protein